MALRNVLGRAAQELEIAPDLARDVGTRHQPDPACGEFETQGQTFDQPADIEDGGQLPLQVEVRVRLLGALFKELHGVGEAAVRSARHGVGKPFNREHVFFLEPQAFPRGDEHLEVGTPAQELRENARALD